MCQLREPKSVANVHTFAIQLQERTLAGQPSKHATGKAAGFGWHGILERVEGGGEKVGWSREQGGDRRQHLSFVRFC